MNIFNSKILVCVLFFSQNLVFSQKINQFDKEGRRTGVWKKNYKNGHIRYRGQFEKGKEVGVFKFYSIQSSKYPNIVKEFSKTNDTAKVNFYSLNGTLKSKGKMFRKDRIGEWLYYFPNGDIMSKESYENGKLEGFVKNFYANGKLTEVTQYKEGKKNGVSKVYSENGTILEIVNYKKGKLNGEGKYYDLKGALKEKGLYRNGKRYGKWEFYINGKLSKKKREKLADL